MCVLLNITGTYKRPISLSEKLSTGEHTHAKVHDNISHEIQVGEFGFKPNGLPAAQRGAGDKRSTPKVLIGPKTLEWWYFDVSL